MLNRQELEALANVPDHELNRYESMGKASAESRGLPYYGRLRSEYKDHFTSFLCMHNRCMRENIEISKNFSRDAEGFINFLLYLGDLQTDTDSLGRRDHTKGYIEGNFRWQPLEENSKESGIRNKKNPSKKKLHSHYIFIEVLEYLSANQNKILNISQLYLDLKKIKKEQRYSLRERLKVLPFITIQNFKHLNNFQVEIGTFDINEYKW